MVKFCRHLRGLSTKPVSGMVASQRQTLRTAWPVILTIRKRPLWWLIWISHSSIITIPWYRGRKGDTCPGLAWANRDSAWLLPDPQYIHTLCTKHKSRVSIKTWPDRTKPLCIIWIYRSSSTAQLPPTTILLALGKDLYLHPHTAAGLKGLDAYTVEEPQ